MQDVAVCIEKDILRDSLLEQKAEVIAMSIYEYNEEYVRKIFMEDGEELGYSRGLETLIRTMRNMKGCNMDVAYMAELTGQEKEFIGEVIELFKTYPEENDFSITRRIVGKR